MEFLSITDVSKRHKVSRNTVAYAVQKKYLKSTQNSQKVRLILKDDAAFYFNGPPFVYRNLKSRLTAT